MDNHFQKVQNYLIELDYNIVVKNEEDGVFLVESENDGIKNLVIGCADPILIMEQYLFDVQEGKREEVLTELLKKNRDMVHGAFVLDQAGSKVIFRDTLQIENLDLNELEGSINSLSLLLSEYSDELIEFSHY